jgi:hypothetical protein
MNKNKKVLNTSEDDNWKPFKINKNFLMLEIDFMKIVSQNIFNKKATNNYKNTVLNSC